MKINSLEDLLIKELQDLYNAENQILEALPLLQNAASSPELKEAFKKHLAETKQQVKRLETALNNLQASPESKTSLAMKGLIDDAKELIHMQANAVLKDAALIAVAQKIEHCEIACYGTARAHAKLLDMDDVADLLSDTLQEESSADKKLTKIAEGTMFTSGINKQASR